MKGAGARHWPSSMDDSGIASALSRIESKLDALIEAMAEDPEEDQSATLDDAGDTRRPVTL